MRRLFPPFGLVAAFVIRRRALAPLRQLTAFARRIATGSCPESGARCSAQLTSAIEISG